MFDVEIKLILVTRHNPSKVKGLDSTVGAIIDADDNLVCLVPLTRMDWVFDCLTAKTKTDHLFTVLSKMTDDEVKLCSACKRNAAAANDAEVMGNPSIVPFDSPRQKARKEVPA